MEGVAESGGVVLLAVGKMRPATEAAKKDPSRGGSGQEVRPSFAAIRKIMTNGI